MRLSRLEKSLPWSGAVAGVAWLLQDPLFHVYRGDSPGAAASAQINGHLGLNYAAMACLVVMGIALVFFATAVRNLLRSAEAREATYSSIVYGGWLLVTAGVSQMVVWNWGLINGAADAKDDAALHALGYVGYFGWAGMGIGIATAYIAMGLAGLGNAVLPKWFSILTIVLGALGALGTAGIPPGGLVNYLLLPFWLVTAAVVVARRQARAARPTSPTPVLT